MTKHERQEIAEAILNELHFRRYNEAIANGCNEKDAMTLADNWELYKDAQALFKFYVDLYNVSITLPNKDATICEGYNKAKMQDYQNRNVLRHKDQDDYYSGWMDCYDWISKGN